MSMTYEQINQLISDQRLTKAEKVLQSMPTKDAAWHFLYSKLLLKKNWFDAAKGHLEKAIALEPNNKAYAHTLAKLMARPNYYSDDYYNRRRYRRNSGCCCCCCGDDCCNISCCDLICLDTCCECMGGDLISCI